MAKETFLDRTHNIVMLIGGFFVIISTLSAYAATKANQSDLEKLQKVHKEDMTQLKKDINQQAVESYTDQIYILENNPKATAHDKSTARYLRGRQADLKLKMAK